MLKVTLAFLNPCFKNSSWMLIPGNKITYLKAGRPVMIKSILQALPLHVMSCLKIPQSIFSLLKKNIKKFYWGGTHMNKKIHWVSWTHLCDKKAEGGLGLRKFDPFNQALLAKQGWNILTTLESLLAQLFNALYFPNTSFLQAEMGSRASPYWKWLLWGRHLLHQGLGGKVGNGTFIDIRKDNWLVGHSNFKLFHPYLVPSQIIKVADIID